MEKGGRARDTFPRLMDGFHCVNTIHAHSHDDHTSATERFFCCFFFFFFCLFFFFICFLIVKPYDAL